MDCQKLIYFQKSNKTGTYDTYIVSNVARKPKKVAHP